MIELHAEGLPVLLVGPLDLGTRCCARLRRGSTNPLHQYRVRRNGLAPVAYLTPLEEP